MDTVMVYTSKGLEDMFAEGGTGHWLANKQRMAKCQYVVATKSNKLRERFPNASNTKIKEGSAFIIGRGLNTIEAPMPGRSIITFEEFAEVNWPKSWTGNRNPITYLNIKDLEKANSQLIEDLVWRPFPTEKKKEQESVEPLTIEQAKKGLAKTLGINPSCIVITINA